MPKAYKVTKRTVMFDKENPKTVYSVSPVSYGILTSEDVANQIAAESSATPGDVKNVLDRYAYYVKENLKKGYSIQLLGFGNLTIRFITTGTAKTEKEANAKLIQGLVPSFTPSFKIINSKRIYDLLPDKITLVKYNGTIPRIPPSPPEALTLPTQVLTQAQALTPLIPAQVAAPTLAERITTSKLFFRKSPPSPLYP